MASKRPKIPSTRPTDPWRRNIANTPPRRKLPAGSDPQITSTRVNRDIALNRNHRFRNYVLHPRSNYYKADPELLRELSRENTHCLYANDLPGRLRFLDILHRNMRACLSLHGQPFFFVTICPGRFASTLANGRSFELEPLKQWASEQLRRLNYVAFVDVALYRRWGFLGPSTEDHLSWHVHAIVWGVTRRQLDAELVAARREPSMVRSNAAVHVKACNADQLEIAGDYEAKDPRKEHWVNSRVSKEPDPDYETGEVLPLYRDQKRPMRTGQQARVAEALIGRTLDRMIFGGSDGSEIVRGTVNEALKPFNRRQRQSPTPDGATLKKLRRR